MATVIGVALIVLICIGVPLEHLATEGTRPQKFGTQLDLWLGAIHGMLLYPAFLIVAAVLSRRARWSIAFTVLVLLAGTVPFVSFVAEHYATKRVRSEFPDVLTADAGHASAA